MPAPILRKIPGLEKRLIGELYYTLGNVNDQLIQSNLQDGIDGIQIGHDFEVGNFNQNIGKWFDSDSTTNINIKHNHPNGPSKRKSWIGFDLGTNRTLDRITITNQAGNSATNSNISTIVYFWTKNQNPKTEAAIARQNLNNIPHSSQAKTTNTLDNIVYEDGGAPYPNKKFQYVAIRLAPETNFDNDGYFNYDNFEIFESFDTRDYSVEFNDSVLDLQSWAGPRYKGCKTLGKKINEFNSFSGGETGVGHLKIGTNFIIGEYPPLEPWKGDITFGKSPNVSNKTTALYITNTIVGGTEEEDIFARIKNHSYIGIDKILLINLDDDTVKILDKETEDFEAFHRFVTTDFPTSGKFNIKILDNYIQNNLKSEYHVKMNKGWLLKSFSYNAADGPLPGMDEDGTELTGTQTDALGVAFDSNIQHTIVNPLALYDFVSGSIQRPDRIFGFNSNIGDQGLYGCADELEPCTGATATVSGSIVDLYSVFSRGPLYGTIDETALLDTTAPLNAGSDIFSSAYTQHAGGELRFRFGTTNKIDNENPVTGPRANFYPFYSGDNTKFIDNKFTREFIKQDNNSQLAVKNFNFPKIQDIKNTQAGLAFGGSNGIYKSNTLNPSVTASLFIGQCVQYLNSHSKETELHLTLFEGTKDFSRNNDEMSISTFEVDRNVNPGYLDFADNLGKLYNTVGPRGKYLKLKNSPQFKPSIPLPSKGINRYVYDLIETSEFQTTIEERQNAFVFGPGTPHENLSANAGINHNSTGVHNFTETYDNSISNSDNFSGSFQYELSFLDKDHTLIADIDKTTELFDGIGGAGAVLIPEYTHEAVKINLYYYLEKAGMINRTTKKKRVPPI